MNNNEKIAITKYDLLYEQRMTRVESAIEGINDSMKEIKTEIKEIRKDMKTDYRWLFGLMLTSTGGLFLLIAHGFKWF